MGEGGIPTILETVPSCKAKDSNIPRLMQTDKLGEAENATWLHKKLKMNRCK